MDFYVTLGLNRGATLLEIKRAYRRLARRFHPDINPGDREAATFFRRIIEAYDTLSDPERRCAYDAHGVPRYLRAHPGVRGTPAAAPTLNSIHESRNTLLLLSSLKNITICSRKKNY